MEHKYIKQIHDLISMLANDELTHGDIVKLVIDARIQRDNYKDDAKQNLKLYVDEQAIVNRILKKIGDLEHDIRK